MKVKFNKVPPLGTALLNNIFKSALIVRAHYEDGWVELQGPTTDSCAIEKGSVYMTAWVEYVGEIPVDGIQPAPMYSLHEIEPKEVPGRAPERVFNILTGCKTFGRRNPLTDAPCHDKECTPCVGEWDRIKDEIKKYTPEGDLDNPTE